MKSIIAVLLLAANAAVAAAAIVEELQFTAVYQGVFSFGQELPIADVELRTTRSAEGVVVEETLLAASSENYELVESLYPMRYRFRSWSTGEGGLLGFESYQRTRRLRHRLFVRGPDGRAFEGYELHAGRGGEKLAELESGRLGALVRPRDELVDRLGLLPRLRNRTLAVGDRFEVPVTGGSKAFRYRVSVEAAEPVRVGPREVAALKLRFDGVRTDRPEGERVAHLPVYLWVDARDGHLPLRAEGRHPIGLFRVDLTGFGTSLLSLRPGAGG